MLEVRDHTFMTSTRKGVDHGVGFCEICHVFPDSIALNIKSIVHFCTKLVINFITNFNCIISVKIRNFLWKW